MKRSSGLAPWSAHPGLTRWAQALHWAQNHTPTHYPPSSPNSNPTPGYAPPLHAPPLLPAGNHGFINIMDMPNTNKYSFDWSWVLSGVAPALCMCVEPASAPANVPSPKGTFGREPAAVKPDDDGYLWATIYEYDNIAKLSQIIWITRIRCLRTHDSQRE
ncbi:hypothetical protein P7K49_023472 [Saguinus oedipus]|uniref:Uncharacterized protein n=1 Tax=Saguinus oedipus TaxID=9490 RepID=A0ABQ9ULT3_SAGOE|nr:hypothetical protein P7K49_023472 [Saguinus oedipus]